MRSFSRVGHISVVPVVELVDRGAKVGAKDAHHPKMNFPKLHWRPVLVMDVLFSFQHLQNVHSATQQDVCERPSPT